MAVQQHLDVRSALLRPPDPGPTEGREIAQVVGGQGSHQVRYATTGRQAQARLRSPAAEPPAGGQHPTAHDAHSDATAAGDDAVQPRMGTGGPTTWC